MPARIRSFSAATHTLRLALLCAAFIPACSSSEDGSKNDDEVEAGVELLGGATTIFDVSRSAYAYPARNLDNEARNAFSLGDHFFNRNWVTAPASTKGGDGLGPTFNAVSCSSCHLKDGRGAPPVSEDEPFLGLLLRLSVPGQDVHGGPLHDPSYGEQLNTKSILGVPVEGVPRVTYTEEPGRYDDGEAYSLRRPVYRVDELAFGPFGDGIMISPRVSPAMHGLGLLEALDDETILAMADPDDQDGDGISGRPNYVWNIRANRHTLGRFGWKANQPTMEQQVAGASLGDIGITTELTPHENCPSVQVDCLKAPSGGTEDEPELSNQKLTAITAYNLTLAVPARRKWQDPVVRRGEELFSLAGCASCHRPKLKTGELAGYPALSNQTIRPFTDVLLHDMGPDLADNRPDFDATGTEWRTPPLWGIGLLKTVSKHEFLLHDGRARGFAEAILWHGGEGARARDTFKAMPKADREALLAFLQDL